MSLTCGFDASADADAYIVTAVGARIHRSVKVLHPANVRIGANVVIGPDVALDARAGKISLGAGTVLEPGASIVALAAGTPVGDWSVLGCGARLVGCLGVGNYVAVAAGAQLLEGSVVLDCARVSPGVQVPPSCVVPPFGRYPGDARGATSSCGARVMEPCGMEAPDRRMMPAFPPVPWTLPALAAVAGSPAQRLLAGANADAATLAAAGWAAMASTAAATPTEDI